MIRKTAFGLTIAVSLASLPLETVLADEINCLILGGTTLAQAVDTTRFIGALTGSFAGSIRAEILEEKKTPNGLSLKMEHFFMTTTGGLLRTTDMAKLTNVKAKDNVYMLEINHDIKDASGNFEGYDGEFQSAGLIDRNTGEVVLKYTGEMCK